MEMLPLPAIPPVVNVLGDAIVCGPEGFTDGGFSISDAFVEEVYAVGARGQSGSDCKLQLFVVQHEGIRCAHAYSDAFSDAVVTKGHHLSSHWPAHCFVHAIFLWWSAFRIFSIVEIC